MAWRGVAPRWSICNWKEECIRHARSKFIKRMYGMRKYEMKNEHTHTHSIPFHFASVCNLWLFETINADEGYETCAYARPILRVFFFAVLRALIFGIRLSLSFALSCSSECARWFIRSFYNIIHSIHFCMCDSRRTSLCFDVSCSVASFNRFISRKRKITLGWLPNVCGCL